MTLTLSSLVWPGGALALLVTVLLLGGRVIQRAGLAGRVRAGRRLQLVETLALDPRRRLVLARCDDRDLLLLLGGSTDLLVAWQPAPSDHSPGGPRQVGETD